MRKLIKVFLIGQLVFFSLFIFSCKQQPSTIEVKKYEISINSLSLKSIADTIVCDMVVKNPDPEDSWMESCLKDFKRKEFIELIFEDIYQNKLLAYEFYTGKLLSVKEVKKIEETSNYRRDIIGKFQFREAWSYDKEKHIFIKKVYSIIFGYETYEENGSVKGYKPLFIIRF